ncbi:DUF6517 family protein [Halomarina halobia]|uniref:DUF6517 family protein n=1 Tax=Halomarina halobia TaxID=3033386 RepID=A0ABD6A969_9EURY|nr:DUF6517 family protein [Halomarina sp. PSR21]
MVNRRRFLAGVATGIVGAMSGCVGESWTHQLSRPATVSSDALRSTGYRKRRLRRESFTRTLEVFGVERTVGVTVLVAEYERWSALPTFDDPVRTGIFGTVSAPRVEVLGQSLNPLDNMPPSVVAGLIDKGQQMVGDLNEDGTVSGRLLGNQVAISRYTAVADEPSRDRRIPIYFTVSQAVPSESDFVLATSMFPTSVPGEHDRILELTRAVEHPGVWKEAG